MLRHPSVHRQTESDGMHSDDILLLGIGIQPPWQLVDQHLDTSTQPHELHLEVAGERGARYPCPTCGTPCPAHDFQQKRWRHLNFFQHHCYITASVPRVKCPEHGVHRVEVPWARKGSAFTLLFEQAALALVREMPVLAAARFMDITDTRLWRIVKHYVKRAITQFDLSTVRGIGLDETASKRGHNYVTIFIDMDRRQEPVLFVTPGRGKETLQQFAAFLASHGGDPQQVLEVVCDMSPAFISGVNEHLRWAVLKRGQVGHLTDNQLLALAEIIEQGLDTATAWRIKEKLAWVRRARTQRAARWRITHYLNWARHLVGETPALEPVRKALATLSTHIDRVVQRWTSTYTNARLEGFNGLFQAARARARGYRNTETFMTMIYLIGSPAGSILKSI